MIEYYFAVAYKNSIPVSLLTAKHAPLKWLNDKLSSHGITGMELSDPTVYDAFAVYQIGTNKPAEGFRLLKWFKGFFTPSNGADGNGQAVERDGK